MAESGSGSSNGEGELKDLKGLITWEEKIAEKRKDSRVLLQVLEDQKQLISECRDALKNTKGDNREDALVSKVLELEKVKRSSKELREELKKKDETLQLLYRNLNGRNLASNTIRQQFRMISIYSLLAENMEMIHSLYPWIATNAVILSNSNMISWIKPDKYYVPLDCPEYDFIQLVMSLQITSLIETENNTFLDVLRLAASKFAGNIKRRQLSLNSLLSLQEIADALLGALVKTSRERSNQAFFSDIVENFIVTTKQTCFKEAAKKDKNFAKGFKLEPVLYLGEEKKDKNKEQQQKTKIRALENEVKNLRNRLIKIVSKKRDDMIETTPEELIQSLQTSGNNVELIEKIKSMGETLGKKEELVATLNSQLLQLQSRLKEANSHAELAINSTNDTFRTVEERTLLAFRERDEAKRKLQEVQIELVQIKSSSEKLRKEIESMRSATSIVSEERNELIQTNRQLQQKYDSMLKEMEKQRKVNEMMGGEIDDWDERNKALKRERDALKEENQRLEADTTRLQTLLREKGKRIDELSFSLQRKADEITPKSTNNDAKMGEELGWKFKHQQLLKEKESDLLEQRKVLQRAFQEERNKMQQEIKELEEIQKQQELLLNSKLKRRQGSLSSLLPKDADKTKNSSRLYQSPSPQPSSSILYSSPSPSPSPRYPPSNPTPLKPQFSEPLVEESIFERGFPIVEGATGSIKFYGPSLLEELKKDNGPYSYQSLDDILPNNTSFDPEIKPVRSLVLPKPFERLYDIVYSGNRDPRDNYKSLISTMLSKPNENILVDKAWMSPFLLMDRILFHNNPMFEFLNPIDTVLPKVNYTEEFPAIFNQENYPLFLMLHNFLRLFMPLVGCLTNQDMWTTDSKQTKKILITEESVGTFIDLVRYILSILYFHSDVLEEKTGNEKKKNLPIAYLDKDRNDVEISIIDWLHETAKNFAGFYTETPVKVKSLPPHTHNPLNMFIATPEELLSSIYLPKGSYPKEGYINEKTLEVLNSKRNAQQTEKYELLSTRTKLLTYAETCCKVVQRVTIPKSHALSHIIPLPLWKSNLLKMYEKEDEDPTLKVIREETQAFLRRTEIINAIILGQKIKDEEGDRYPVRPEQRFENMSLVFLQPLLSLFRFAENLMSLFENDAKTTSIGRTNVEKKFDSLSLFFDIILDYGKQNITEDQIRKRAIAAWKDRKTLGWMNP